jgi:glycosyltransferase involved in cell wall biosynthesis
VTAARLVHVFPAFASGGPEVRTATLINTLTDFSHAIVSLSGDDSGRARLASPDAVPVSVPGRGWKLRSIARAIAAYRPALVITYGWGGTDAIVAARMAGLGRPLHVEDGFLPDEATRQKPLRLQVRRVTFRLAGGLIVPSRTLERIATRDWWLPASTVRFIPNGIDTTRFAPATPEQRLSARRAAGAGVDDVVIGTVAALRPDKNHARLIRAVRALPAGRPVRLLVVGDGPCRPALERQVAESELRERVTFMGSQVDPSSAYHAMDVFALSSDTEQMPLSILEAMASGLPVASPDIGDVSGMVPEGGGIVSPRGDEQALTEAIARLAGDAPLRRAGGVVNRACVIARFSVERMIDAYRAAFVAALNGSRKF